MNTFFELLRSQSGQIVQDGQDDAGAEVDTGTEPTDTSGADSDVDPFAQAADQIQTSVPVEGQGVQQDAQPAPDTFLSESDLDPRTLTDPKLQAIFKRMQGVYTKRMQGIAEYKQKAEIVDRFNQDRDFAAQTLVSWAAQNGYQLTPIGQQAPAQPGKQAQQLTQQQKMTLDGLPPELQWMAEPMGGAVQQAVTKAVENLLQPLIQHQQQTNRQNSEAEFDRYANELSQKVPHWQEHEETMSELYDFLTSKAQSHPKFGSKLELLFDLATKKAAAISEATKRVNQAAKNRTVTARGGVRAQAPQDITKLSKEDAWAAAVNRAKANLNR